MTQRSDPGTDPEPQELARLSDPAALRRMRAADVAELIGRLQPRAPTDAARALVGLPFPLAVQVLDEPELRHAGQLLTSLVAIDEATSIALLEEMSPDRQVALLRTLPDAERARLIAALAPATRGTVEQLLRYPATSAGGMMTPELVAIPGDWTAAEAIAHVRRTTDPAEAVHEVYVTGGGTTSRLEHVVSLRELISARPDQPIAGIGDRRAPVTVTPLADREDVARLIARYNLVAVPVVDADGRLLGIVTVDDVIDAIVSEQTEDAQKFGGLEALDVPYTETGFWTLTGKRAGWLAVLFFGEMLTATAMSHYEREIAHAVVLALFVPLIISSGGNSGSQATSLVIRALAVRELSLGDWWRVILRELPSGLALGAILGVAGVLRVLVWQAAGWYDYGAHAPLIALTIGVALLGVVAFGSVTGAMLPFILQRLGFDPVSASAPFVATLVDVTGLVIYFSVASAILRGTLL